MLKETDRLSLLERILRLRLERYIKSWTKVKISIKVEWTDRKNKKYILDNDIKEIPLERLEEYIEMQKSKLISEFKNRKVNLIT
jgi:hypothetical protein